MKHLLIDCENIVLNFKNIDFSAGQHIWFFLYENSDFQIPLIVSKPLLEKKNFSVVRFPQKSEDHFFYFLSFQLGKISHEDPEADFLLLTTKKFIQKSGNLFHSFQLKLDYQCFPEEEIVVPPPTEQQNKVPEPANSQQNPVISKVFKQLAYDLFYQKSYFPLLQHNLEKKIRRYMQQFAEEYEKDDENFIIDQVLQTLKKKEYLLINSTGKIDYKLSATDIYQNALNRICQNRPTHYYQMMKMINLEVDFLKLPEERLALLFDKLEQSNIFVKVDDFIIYLDEPTELVFLQEIAYKVALNTLANPEIKPKTIQELIDYLQVFTQFSIKIDHIIEQLIEDEIITVECERIIYNPKYEIELDKYFPQILLFLCKAIGHTQPRYRETLINYIFHIFEDKKVDFFTVYLFYYRLIQEKYIVNDSRSIQYYLPPLEHWN